MKYLHTRCYIYTRMSWAPDGGPNASRREPGLGIPFLLAGFSLDVETWSKETKGSQELYLASKCLYWHPYNYSWVILYRETCIQFRCSAISRNLVIGHGWSGVWSKNRVDGVHAPTKTYESDVRNSVRKLERGLVTVRERQSGMRTLTGGTRYIKVISEVRKRCEWKIRRAGDILSLRTTTFLVQTPNPAIWIDQESTQMQPNNTTFKYLPRSPNRNPPANPSLNSQRSRNPRLYRTLGIPSQPWSQTS